MFLPVQRFSWCTLLLNKQGDNIQPWCTLFPIWNQSVVPCPVLTFASLPAYRFLKRQVTFWQICWYSFRECLCVCVCLITKLCPTLWNFLPISCQAPLSVGVFRQKSGVVAILFFRGSSWPRESNLHLLIQGGFFTVWATREALYGVYSTILITVGDNSISCKMWSLEGKATRSTWILCRGEKNTWCIGDKNKTIVGSREERC